MALLLTDILQGYIYSKGTLRVINLLTCSACFADWLKNFIIFAEATYVGRIS